MMTQSAWTRDGRPIDATEISLAAWETLKLRGQLGDFVMPCCKAPAVLKTSINGRPFFAHLKDECSTAPETIWHRAGKTAVIAGLSGLGIEGCEEVRGQSPDGEQWEADVLFSVGGRSIVIELQRFYQHLREFTRRQERYAASSSECYWLVRRETFITLAKATSRLRLKRDFGNVFPAEGIGTGMLPELPVAMLNTENGYSIQFGSFKSATLPVWLAGVVDGSYRYRKGSWNLN
ncbi:competence protein CoiA [Pseudomonas syringae]|uniref:competence protein CoiA n=1 Tax=Pseudomonas syringae TaxID=317 RepID=UPI001F104FE2|nr:competence protein CoiA family protein [Pseudomonas syringae]MCH5507711.1 competence protein CoiA [Pseudomonas syringae pv. syringae]MCH5637103.1 competence protein CoiA [Pseudomonas syringae pv. syringae]MCH7426236.1 competence protein CoiA [Pseudomonas syringae pv. syringae]